MKKLSIHFNQRGVSMTEALVALVVLSVGMLGIAGLFIESLRANRSATSRMHAVNLVNEMTDRILANRLAGNAYALPAGVAPADKGCVADSNCTIEDLAVDDLATWVEAVRDVMPPDVDGNPAITVIDVNSGANISEPTQYRVSIRWSEPGEARPFRYTNTIQITPGNIPEGVAP